MGQLGATAHATGVKTQDHALTGDGAAASWNERAELSLARQDLDAKDNLAPLGLTQLRLKQDIFGIKARVAGDAVLDSDSGCRRSRWACCTSAGALGPTRSSARSEPGTTAPTGTSAHQALPCAGRAGQPDVARDAGEPEPAYLINRHLVVGIEERAKPDNQAWGGKAGIRAVAT